MDIVLDLILVVKRLNVANKNKKNNCSGDTVLEHDI